MDVLAPVFFALFVLVLRATIQDAAGDDDDAPVTDWPTMGGRRRCGSISLFDTGSFGPTVNPATGLPMMGCVDVGGNAYGCGGAHWD